MKRKIKAANFPANQSHDGTHSSQWNGACQPPRKRVTAKPVTANNPRYSPRKNRAYLNPEYSVRKPAMISDSPSGRSKGERLDSAVAAMRNKSNPASPQGVNTFHRANPPKV